MLYKKQTKNTYTILAYLHIFIQKKIHNLDVSFIVEDDYSLDEFRGGETVREVLIKLRQPISNLNDDIKRKAAICILNMSKLSFYILVNNSFK